jgi:hypothetical protein
MRVAMKLCNGRNGGSRHVTAGARNIIRQNISIYHCVRACVRACARVVCSHLQDDREQFKSHSCNVILTILSLQTRCAWLLCGLSFQLILDGTSACPKSIMWHSILIVTSRKFHLLKNIEKTCSTTSSL